MNWIYEGEVTGGLLSVESTSFFHPSSEPLLVSLVRAPAGKPHKNTLSESVSNGEGGGRADLTVPVR